MNTRAKHNANPLNTRGGPKELPTVRAVVTALANNALSPRQAIRKLDAIVLATRVAAFQEGMNQHTADPYEQLNLEDQPHA